MLASRLIETHGLTESSTSEWKHSIRKILMEPLTDRWSGGNFLPNQNGKGKDIQDMLERSSRVKGDFKRVVIN